jgi:hypothetical protein
VFIRVKEVTIRALKVAIGGEIMKSMTKSLVVDFSLPMRRAMSQMDKEGVSYLEEPESRDKKRVRGGRSC